MPGPLHGCKARHEAAGFMLQRRRAKIRVADSTWASRLTGHCRARGDHRAQRSIASSAMLRRFHSRATPRFVCRLVTGRPRCALRAYRPAARDPPCATRRRRMRSRPLPRRAGQVARTRARARASTRCRRRRRCTRSCPAIGARAARRLAIPLLRDQQPNDRRTDSGTSSCATCRSS